MASGRRARAEQRPAESFDDADHRVERVDRPPALGEQAARVGDRGGEQPDLHQERHHVAHVAVPDVERGEPEADAERGGEREQRRAGRATRHERPGAMPYHAIIAEQHDERRARSRRAPRAPSPSGMASRGK